MLFVFCLLLSPLGLDSLLFHHESILYISELPHGHVWLRVVRLEHLLKNIFSGIEIGNYTGCIA